MLFNFMFLQNQTQATETQIKAGFEQLRDFLQREETARLAALQQESEEKKELVRKKSEGITSGILTFSHAVIAVENEIASADALFLKVGVRNNPVLGPIVRGGRSAFCTQVWLIV